MNLQVISTRFHTSENAVKHHTELFQLQQAGKAVVFRRGRSFLLEISFNRCLDPNKDIIRIDITPASNTAPASNTTNNTFTIKEKKLLNANKWRARFVSFGMITANVQVQIPTNAAVTEWKIAVLTARKSFMKYQIEFKRFPINMPVYVLFNPWCTGDGVYMEDAAQLDEYVLNDKGKVWRGTYKNPEGYKWFFGQFEPVILPSIMILLNRSSIAAKDRADPVMMARCISAITNSNDDNGLIVGNWSGNYDDGTRPNTWTGSPLIFKEFYKTQKPVKYGQCWVFSGVLVTICRALGIPCRSVTNYQSAHDTDASLTIEWYYDVDSYTNISQPGKDDSVWNFHVWNDVWMDRPDLNKGYGGWQCIDGTPQEKSSNMYMCGPAPVEAIRQGKVKTNYDTRFVFTEVRADIRYFKKSADGSRVETSPDQVGKRIVTKKIGQKLLPGNEDLEDITDVYKNPYGTPEDLMAMKTAIKAVPNAKKIYHFKETQIQDVKFELTDIERIMFGESFYITVNLHNKSSKSRSISIVVSATSVLYTGAKINRLTHGQKDITVKPNERKTWHALVKSTDYMEKLSTHSFIRITAVANVKETQQLWTQNDDFVVQKPPLTLKLYSIEPQENKPFVVTISFTNPLNATLTHCTFSVDGPAIHKIVKFRDVKPGEKDVNHTETFTAAKNGFHTIAVIFNSKQLTDIKNSIVVPVSPIKFGFRFDSHQI